MFPSQNHLSNSHQQPLDQKNKQQKCSNQYLKISDETFNGPHGKIADNRTSPFVDQQLHEQQVMLQERFNNLEISFNQTSHDRISDSTGKGSLVSPMLGFDSSRNSPYVDSSSVHSSTSQFSYVSSDFSQNSHSQFSISVATQSDNSTTVASQMTFESALISSSQKSQNEESPCLFPLNTEDVKTNELETSKGSMTTITASPSTSTSTSYTRPLVSILNAGDYAANIPLDMPRSTSPLPDPHLVSNVGDILSRISFRTIMFKKWRTTFWVQYGPKVLLIFRCKDDAENWLYNPYRSAKDRKALIKLKIDFNKDLRSSSRLSVTKISSKFYSRDFYHQFKLVRWTDMEYALVAAFGSRELQETTRIRDIMFELIKGDSTDDSSDKATKASETQYNSSDCHEVC